MERLESYPCSSLIAAYVCPVCLDYMIPPIPQCYVGHEICARCFEKIETCPVCRQPRGESRSLTMERIYDHLTFPCRHREQGCDYLAVGKTMRKHDKFCEYATFFCPLSAFFKDCVWTGRRSEILRHCNDIHPFKVRYEKLLTYYLPLEYTYFEMSVRNELSYIYLLFQTDHEGGVYKVCFGIHWDGTLYCGVFSYGSEKNISKYKFRFIFGEDDSRHLWLDVSPDYPIEEFPKNRTMIDRMSPFAHFREFSRLFDKFGFLKITIEKVYEENPEKEPKVELIKIKCSGQRWRRYRGKLWRRGRRHENKKARKSKKC